MESVNELYEKIVNVKAKSRRTEQQINYLKTKTSEEVFNMMDYIVKEYIKTKNMLNEYKNKHYKPMTFGRTIQVCNILMPKIKESYVVEKIILMAHDMEREEWKKIELPLSTKTKLYWSMWFQCFVVLVEREAYSFRLEIELYENNHKYYVNDEEITPWGYFDKLVGYVKPTVTDNTY